MADTDICTKCDTADPKSGIVHSGTDAFLLGCMNALHNICYDCANMAAFGRTA